MEERQPQHEYFKAILLTVVGQAFDAAGYVLEEHPMQWASGQYRFSKALRDDLTAYIEFQVLVYSDTMWASGNASRFRVNLIRSDRPAAQASQHPQYVRRTLSQLVVDDFGVSILPASDHWWPFSDTDSLGKALAEAGHLVIGYGMPWLSGDLLPPQS